MELLLLVASGYEYIDKKNIKCSSSPKAIQGTQCGFAQNEDMHLK